MSVFRLLFVYIRSDCEEFTPALWRSGLISVIGACPTALGIRKLKSVVLGVEKSAHRGMVTAQSQVL